MGCARWLRLKTLQDIRVGFGQSRLAQMDTPLAVAVRLWDVQDGTCLQQHTIIPVGLSLLRSQWSSHASRWRSNHSVVGCPTAPARKYLQGHTSLVCSVQFSPVDVSLPSGAGPILVSGVRMKPLLWNPTTGECLKTLRADRLYEGMNIQALRD